MSLIIIDNSVQLQTAGLNPDIINNITTSNSFTLLSDFLSNNSYINSTKQNLLTASTILSGIGSNLTSIDYNKITINKPTNFQSDWNSTIINKPTNFQSDWNSTIINKPTNFQCDYNTTLINKPSNFQCDYNTTLINKPTNFQADWNSTIINKPSVFNPDLTNIYTKNQVDTIANLSNFYNKTTMDSSLNSKENVLSFSAPLSRSINNITINLNSYVPFSALNTCNYITNSIATLNNFYNKSDSDSRFTQSNFTPSFVNLNSCNYINNSIATLTNFYNKSDSDSRFTQSNFTPSFVNLNSCNFDTIALRNNALLSYVPFTALSASNYITNNTNGLINYVNYNTLNSCNYSSGTNFLKLDGTNTMSAQLSLTGLASGNNPLYISSTNITANNCIQIKNNSTYNAYIGIGGTGFGGNYANNLFIESAQSSIIFNTNGRISTSTPNMIINSSGNVGIGTLSPNASLELSSTTQTLPRIILSGQEFYDTGTDTNGIALLAGVNRIGNRQLWIADSANLAKNAVNKVLRIYLGGIDSIATNGTTILPLTLGNSGNTTSIYGSTIILNNNTTIGTSSSTSVNTKLTISGASSGYSEPLVQITQTNGWNGNYALQVSGYTNLGGVRINGSDTGNTIYQSLLNSDLGISQNPFNTTGGSISLITFGTGASIKFYTGGVNERMSINSSGGVNINGSLTCGGTGVVNFDGNAYVNFNGSFGFFCYRPATFDNSFQLRLQTTTSQNPHDYVGVPVETAGGSSSVYQLYLILNSFTGLHRCFTNDELFNEEEPQIFKDTYEGRIVVASGKIATQIGNEKDGYEINYDKSGITIEDAHPIIELSRKKKDKRVFGVLGMKNRKNSNEKRLIINSIGEGGIWVINSNGNIENGDYITSSDYLGYGEKQEDDILHNYSVAKSTIDCSFELNSPYYNCYEIDDLDINGNKLKIAFISCSYHSG